MDMNDFRTPGQLIEFLLSQRGWTQRLLAVILGADETGLNKIVIGKRSVNADMALMLGEVFDIPAEHFLNLQKEYDLAQARIVARPDAGRAKRAHLFGGLPVSEMIKRGWLDAENIREVPKIESALVKFFGVNSTDEIEILPHATKKTSTFTPATPAQLAWIYRVKEIAGEMLAPKYSKQSLEKAVSSLRNLMEAPEEARKVPRILAECGVRFVIVQTLASAKIDGVCFWLNETSPVIGLSLRYDRIDNFWFVLRHEIEHVLRQHGRSTIMLDAELEGDCAGTGENVPEEERLANEAAMNFCVPHDKIEKFVARKAPFFNERDILGFAQTMHVHPGLIAGQLQHLTGKYNRFRQYLVKIRDEVTPSATVDGWGDIAPVDY